MAGMACTAGGAYPGGNCSHNSPGRRYAVGPGLIRGTTTVPAMSDDRWGPRHGEPSDQVYGGPVQALHNGTGRPRHARNFVPGQRYAIIIIPHADPYPPRTRHGLGEGTLPENFPGLHRGSPPEQGGTQTGQVAGSGRKALSLKRR